MRVWLPLCALLLTAAAAQRAVDPQTHTDSLLYVHAVWRHGDRTPSVLIPTDYANNITTWQLGLGELTREGEAQQFRLGQYLRRRYDGFLGRAYSPFEVFVRSSDYNRTLASAQANLAGLYYPTEGELFVPELHWRPIPVHTMPKGSDQLLFDTVFCPAATAEEQRVYASAEVVAIERENGAFLRFLGQQSGLPKVPLPLRDMWDVFDPLNSESFHQSEHPFPAWVNATVREEIWRLYHLSCYYLYHTDLLTRLRGGPLFADVVNRMKAVVAGRHDPREKLYVYSAHDTSVSAILAAFGIRPQTFPVYASLVLVELHATAAEPEVRLFYKNETDGATLWEWDVPGCARPCTLAKLETAKAPVMPLNWAEECGLYNGGVGVGAPWHHLGGARAYLLVIGLLSVCCAALLVELVVLKVRHRRERTESAAYHRCAETSSSGRLLLQMDDETQSSSSGSGEEDRRK